LPVLGDLAQEGLRRPEEPGPWWDCGGKRPMRLEGDEAVGQRLFVRVCGGWLRGRHKRSIKGGGEFH
jgi:hypothetical protein